MKKILLCLLVLALTGPGLISAQEIITGYTFPTGDTLTDIYPDQGLPGNSNYYLGAEDTTAHPNTIQREIFFTEGYSSFAASATGWEDGASAKLWSIKFKAEGYIDLTVSSKQYSGATDPGPRDFKIQARLSGEDWVDLAGGEITVANDWTTGVAENIALPDMFDNPGTTSLYIRWIMTTNNDINGGTITAAGISKIDDIVVKGINVSGIEEIIADSRFSFFPNPSDEGFINIISREDINEIIIYDIQGKEVQRFEAASNRLDIGILEPGIYFIKPVFASGSASAAHRLVIR